MSLSTHRPSRSRLRRWPQPGGHTPTFRSTLQAPAPCGAWGNPGLAASRPGCSGARSRSARRGKRTGTYSWGKRSGRSDRQNRPKRTHRPRELQERTAKWLSGSTVTSCIIVGGGAHQRRGRSSCGRLWRSHTAALSACRRGSCPSTPAPSDGRTPGSRRSHPGSGAPRGDTWGAPPGTGIYGDRPGTRPASTPKKEKRKRMLLK